VTSDGAGASDGIVRYVGVSDLAETGLARVAVVGSPRSGNTWIRRLLSDALDAAEIAVHHPGDVDWRDLPERCVIQLHWMPTRRLRTLFRRARIRAVSPARHPLDVLLSVLVFVQRGQETSDWLPGTGDDTVLRSATPYSPEFLSWAASPRARALLSVTPAWWALADVVKASYEDFLADPERALGGVLQRLAMDPTRELGVTVSVNPPERLHLLSGGIHVWQARAGVHREVLTAELCDALMDVHGDGAERLGYARDVRVSADLDSLAGLAAWVRLQPEPSGQSLHTTWSRDGQSSDMVSSHGH